MRECEPQSPAETGTVTPFIRTSIRWTYLDSNIPNGPVTGTCWWDPWWGYICTSWQSTYDDTAFSYGAGIGVRADLANQVFLEASANELWIDLSNSDNPSFVGYRLNIGWTY